MLCRKGINMLGAFVEGYSDPEEVEYCPYCGSDIYTRRAGGMAMCRKCHRAFAVIDYDEDDEGEGDGTEQPGKW